MFQSLVSRPEPRRRAAHVHAADAARSSLHLPGTGELPRVLELIECLHDANLRVVFSKSTLGSETREAIRSTGSLAGVRPAVERRQQAGRHAVEAQGRGGPPRILRSRDGTDVLS